MYICASLLVYVSVFVLCYICDDLQSAWYLTTLVPLKCCIQRVGTRLYAVSKAYMCKSIKKSIKRAKGVLIVEILTDIEKPVASLNEISKNLFIAHINIGKPGFFSKAKMKI